MGLLSLGTPLSWDEAQLFAEHVRQHGIIQLLNIYRRLKNKQRDRLLWGDEIEFMLVALTDKDNPSKPATCTYSKNAVVRLSQNGYSLWEKLHKEEEECLEGKSDATPAVLWRPEYAKYMLEALPGKPYGSDVKALLTVEENMSLRRHKAKEFANPNERLLSMVNFPLLGSRSTPFLDPHVDMSDLSNMEKNKASRSLFIPDAAINPHPRFKTLTANIRNRRGHKVGINLPIFRDKNTPSPFRETGLPSLEGYPDPYESGEALPDHVYLDCMAFGMGCCCLQLTFQASTIDEARRLYDQLTVISPLTMALSAGSPIFRGYLVDTDCRWDVIAGSVDDRNFEERGITDPNPLLLKTASRPLVPGTTSSAIKKRRIYKSRYGSVSCFISNHPTYREYYNDLPIVVDEEIQEKLATEMDNRLARHFAHLYIRDPLVIYKELVEQDDETSSDHFENIQSTNWQTMRFKPPPPGADNIGWRVEFRALEIQLTDFENAAFAVFVVLLTRAILTFDLNFYIPISKVDRNMDLAAHRDSVLREKFWVRREVFSDKGGWAKMDLNKIEPSFGGSRRVVPTPGASAVASGVSGTESPAAHAESSMASGLSSDSPISEDRTPDASPGEDYALLTLDDIFNGKPGEFPGLIPLVEIYLNSLPLDVNTHCRLCRYLEHVRARARGSLATNANWMRRFVRTHPEYQYDSVVNDRVATDLVKKCLELGEANIPIQEPPYYVTGD